MQLIVRNFCQNLHDLADQHVSSFENNTACLHRFHSAIPSNAVEVGEVNDHEFPHAKNFTQQLGATIPDVGIKLPTTLSIENRFRKHPRRGANEHADVMLQENCGPGSGLGCFSGGGRRRGRCNNRDGGGAVHGALSKWQWQA
jgi:hypothetical protein